MQTLTARRRFPFAIGLGVLAIVSVAVARLPEAFVSGLERDSRFSFSQATWIFRLFVISAVLQGLYGGFGQFRVERVQKALARDEKAAAFPKEKLIAIVARNAVVAALIVLVYGIVLLALTGLRGSFWVFPLVTLAAGAWYYRLVGDVARWLSFQPEPEPERPRSEWRREPPDYCPPLARGLVERR